MARTRKKSLYSVHPGVAMTQKWVAELPEKTGRSLEEWMALVQSQGPKDEKACREWLKKEFGLGTNSAWWIAERGHSGDVGLSDTDPDAYLAGAEKHVEEMFAGPRAGLRPAYDALLRLGLAVGPESKACPCKTIVPLYRNHVFAQIKPATRTRIEMGFALGASPFVGRLFDTGGLAKKNRITHAIAIGSVDDIDQDVEHWLNIAYDRDA